MPENNLDIGTCWLIGIVAVIFLLVLIVRFAVFVNDFSSELRYLNSEIQRATDAELRYWIRKRQRLWLSLIPFVKYR